MLNNKIEMSLNPYRNEDKDITHETKIPNQSPESYLSGEINIINRSNPPKRLM